MRAFARAFGTHVRWLGFQTRAIEKIVLRDQWNKLKNFVPVCAVEMHMGISQEPFCVEIDREAVGRESRGHYDIGASLRSRDAHRQSDANLGAIVLCEPTQSICTYTFHKSHRVWKFTRTLPEANLGTTVLCEPTQSNRHGHFAKTILCGNLQGNGWTRMIPPRRLNTGPWHALSLRTTQCGHTVCVINKHSFSNMLITCLGFWGCSEIVQSHRHVPAHGWI